jgi:hypothetical protein
LQQGQEQQELVQPQQRLLLVPVLGTLPQVLLLLVVWLPMRLILLLLLACLLPRQHG